MFNRQELLLEFEADVNPGFAGAKKKISEELNKNEENIDVIGVKSIFGRKKFQIEAKIYDSKEDLEKIKNLEMTGKQRKEKIKADREKKKESQSEEKKSAE